MGKNLNIEKRRLLILIVLFLFLFLIITIKLIKLTIIDNIRTPARERNYSIFQRGGILDCNYKQLAVSIKVYSLFCNTLEMENINAKKLDKISSILKIKKSTLKKIFSKKKKFIWLKRQVDHKTMKDISDLNIKGIYNLREYKRFYPNNRLGSHVLGITGIDNIGLEGVELYYDKYLNSTIHLEGKQEKFNLVLSIDKTIQYIVETELKKTIKKTQAKSGTVIIMEPATGYITAMASIPDFDPNQFSRFSQKVRQNHAVLGIFEPGSIFKIFSLAMIYTEKAVKDRETFECPGHALIGGEKISCWKKDGHGRLNFHQVIKQSCNVGMIKVIIKTSRFKFYNTLLNFNIRNYTGIDLPGEARGILRKPKGMGKFSQASISLGQEVSTTAIQLITAAASIYNDGKLMEPKIVKAIIKDDGTIYKEFKPIVIRQAVAPSIANKIKQDMKGVVEEGGTGELAYIKGYTIGGKTGTGEIYDRKLKRYDKNKVNSSFIGFFPADKARYGIIVTIHEPKTKEKAGGKIAAPLFKNIVEKMISYKETIPKTNILTPRTNGFKPPYNNSKVKKSNTLPLLKNKNMREVINILKTYNVKPNLVGSGISFKQEPPAGSKINKGMLVTVWFREP